jgi:hypothetical protein
MSLKNAMFIGLAVTSLFCACKNDKEEVTSPVPLPKQAKAYSNLKTGNYWIYQRFTVDTNGNAYPLQEFDSCYVEKDTLIGGKTYHKVFRPNPYFAEMSTSYLRDSLHYVVNQFGAILFSVLDFSSVFKTSYLVISDNDTIARIEDRMGDKNLVIAVPAGIFNTSSFNVVYNFYPKWSALRSVRKMQTRYAKNVGIVSEVLPFFLSNPNYTERRLVRYKLN